MIWAAGKLLTLIDGPVAGMCDRVRALAIRAHRFAASIVGGE